MLSSLDRFAGVASGSFEKLACSRRRACFGGTARSIRRGIRSTTSFAIFASDVSVVIPLRALRPRSRTNPGLNHRGHLHRRAVTQRRFLWPRDAFGRSRFERRFLLGRSRSFRRRLVSNLAPRGGLRLSGAPKVSLRQTWARAQFWCARGIPTKLAPAHVPLAVLRRCCVTFRWGPKPEHPTSAVRFSTHGHTRRSSRSSSARGCRLCPRSITPTRLAPSRRARLGLHDSPSEEPCPLRPSPATDLSVVALAKLAFTSNRASRDADHA